MSNISGAFPMIFYGFPWLSMFFRCCFPGIFPLKPPFLQWISHGVPRHPPLRAGNLKVALPGPGPWDGSCPWELTTKMEILTGIYIYYIYAYIYIHITLHMYIYICIFVCMYLINMICMHACMYIIYIYISHYTYIYSVDMICTCVYTCNYVCT